MKFAFANQKGGVTKTTTTGNTAYLAAVEHNKRVLIIDSDPQKNVTSLFLPYYKELDKSETLYAALYEQKPVKVHKTRIPNLDIVPSHLSMSRVESLLRGEIGGHNRLREAIETIEDNYDYIFIDCPPSLGFLLVNALSYADKAVIPISHEGFEDDGLGDLVDTIKQVKKSYNRDLNIVGLLQTKTDSRTNLSNNFKENLVEKYGDLVFKASIPRAVVAEEANDKKLTIPEYIESKPKNLKKTKWLPVLNSYKKFTSELLNK